MLDITPTWGMANPHALEDFRNYRRGSARAPQIDQNWAKVHGEEWFKAYNEFTNGIDVESNRLKLLTGWLLARQPAQDEKAQRLRVPPPMWAVPAGQDRAPQQLQGGLADRIQRLSRDRTCATWRIPRPVSRPSTRCAATRLWADKANMRPGQLRLDDPTTADSFIDYNATRCTDHLE
jgi:hypothetical protein